MTDKDIVLRDEKFISDVYNQFSPDYPLPDEDSRYVSCREVRGDDNIIRAVGRKITLSDVPTYQLYTGHRGGGKSTEIAHLKAYLEEKGCRVIYFEADEYMDTKDVNYTDILLACTRRIVED
ncbi:MAG: ATP-binding protein, partial [Microcystaceae cyanobacterium]